MGPGQEVVEVTRGQDVRTKFAEVDPDLAFVSGDTARSVAETTQALKSSMGTLKAKAPDDDGDGAAAVTITPRAS